MMKLIRFRVTNFRSVMDSGWIDCDKITSLVGINESGKSNIILALWKLKPAREGEIDLLHDMPAKEYSSWRNNPEQKVFISAVFELDESLLNKVSNLVDIGKTTLTHVQITRKYDGEYLIGFPNYEAKDDIPVDTLQSVIISARSSVNELNERTKGETGVKSAIISACDKILEFTSSKKIIKEPDIDVLNAFFPKDIAWAAKSELAPALEALKKSIEVECMPLFAENPAENQHVRQLLLSELPSFVYYSNYGNLNAKIYLPHAVKLIKGEKIPGYDEAQARTLRVLFDFVNLAPQEVLNLGKDPTKLVIDQSGKEKKVEPTEEEIQEATRKKEERATLLQSASTKLTRDFADWWKQGTYKIRLQADGDFFKIWVSDDKRPEEIELERRSTGLQWFLSFFLVFLVESKDAHKGAILLLDEAGLTLHPMSQKDLVSFFENLSNTNQIIHTTHSPFLVDTTNIDRVKVVFSDEKGFTVVSSDLRAAGDKLNEKSIYAVHAALGLTVSDILLQGCQPIIVEGPSDQYYLNAIKQYLIKTQRFSPNKELVFVPSGGIKGVPGVVGIVSSREGDLPFVILDADKGGRDSRNKLQSKLYVDAKEKIIDTSDLIDFDNSEIEDLIPLNLMERHINRTFHAVEGCFTDKYDSSQPIVPQIESFATRHNIILEEGWKVRLAKNVRYQLLDLETEPPNEFIEKWIALFSMLNVSTTGPK